MSEHQPGVVVEQRQHLRSESARTVEVVDVESGVEFDGEARNVSSVGLLLHASMEPVVGADLQVYLKPQGAEQPERVTLHVKRVERRDGGFDIAGALTTHRK